MNQPQSFGAKLRLDRIDRNGDGRLMIVPLDHSVADGPVTPDDSLEDLIGELAAAKVDAVVLHKGTARHLNPKLFVNTSLIVHLNASTSHAPDPDAKYLVTSVEAALRLGADAVSVHVNMGSKQEAEQIADLARTAEETERWGMPLLAMMYARGPQIDNSADPELVRHSATLAADLGADLVKVSYPGSASAMADVVRACPIPVLIAGGPPVDDKRELLQRVSATVRAGAAGVAMGRNIFQHPTPGRLAREIGDVVHGRMAIAA